MKGKTMENMADVTEEDRALLSERYRLAMDRVSQIPQEHFGAEAFERYFAAAARFLLLIDETGSFIGQGGLNTAPVEELAKRNRELYEDAEPKHYAESYLNPEYAVNELGEELGPLLSHLYYRLFRLIGFVYENNIEEITVRTELFVEVYTEFVYRWQEDNTLPDGPVIKDILYWSASDYLDLSSEREIREMLCPKRGVWYDIVKSADLNDVRYLYAYGEYVSDNELETAKFMAGLDEATIASMADTYTEGYRIGFEVTGKDLSRKGTVKLGYRLGFERMMRRAVENFEKLGLSPISYRGGYRGFGGAPVNRQMDYDHRNDDAIYLDRQYVNRKLDTCRAALEKYRVQAGRYAGPAYVETFGEEDFKPVNKPHAYSMSEEQNRLKVEFEAKYDELTNQYIPQEEVSFTIIAFPIPQIGPVFKELFEETIRINTLDYRLYRDVQQKLIDALDQADFCIIRGMNGNRTDLKVNLWKLKDPQKETIFENCVADVNIPVGEVFTSPVLEGTEGVLHVKRFLLKGMEFKDLTISFRDGMITDYCCSNFDVEEENRRFVMENVLYRHETLPLGEFAIGTNTTAYVVARRLGVEDKFPILIAEKTGPHFAVGDTCYSHVEDVKVYNPDGKEIVARENSVAALRNEKPLEAYFNCHTDITIPYDELGELTAVRKDGSLIPVIREGRFVLEGTEILNRAFE